MNILVTKYVTKAVYVHAGGNTASGVHGRTTTVLPEIKPSRFLTLQIANAVVLFAGGNTARGVHGPTLTVLPETNPSNGEVQLTQCGFAVCRGQHGKWRPRPHSDGAARSNC
jgi:predicted small secreted protein